MKKSTIILCSTFFLTQCWAQAPAIEWQRAFGGTNSDDAIRIKQTADNGYIFAGQTASANGDITFNYGSSDAWIVEINVAGIIEWQKNYGGSSGDSFNDIIQTSDGGYIAVGSSSSIDGDLPFAENQSGRYWIVKLSASGTIEWQKLYGGSSSDSAFSIKPTSDGGYITIGTTQSNNGDVTGFHGATDIWVVKLDAAANLQWQKTLGGSSLDRAEFIEQTTNGGYLVTGYTASSDGDITLNKGSNDFWIVRLNTTGSIEWQTTYGGSGNDGATSAVQTSDGGYLISGSGDSGNGDLTPGLGLADGWLFKLDLNGAVEWKRALGGSNHDGLRYIQLSDNKLIIAGQSFSTDGQLTQNNGLVDCWILKTDLLGTIEWQHSFGGSDRDYPFYIAKTADNGYIFIARTLSDNGDVSNYHGDFDIWAVKLEADVLDNKQFHVPDASVFPNPAKSKLHVNLPVNATCDRIVIYDVTGKVISQAQHTSTINIEELASGIYILEAFSGTKKHNVKFIKE